MTWIDVIDLVRLNPPSAKEVAQVHEYRKRKAKARFLADENFPTLATEVLRKMGGRVTTVQQIGSRHHPDENHAAFALKHGYILITMDRDYLNERRFPLIHCPAIAVFDFGPGSEVHIRQAFTCLARVLRSPQFFDKWVKIDAKREFWTEHFRCLDGTSDRLRYRVCRGTIQQWI